MTQNEYSLQPQAASQPTPDCKKYMTYRADSGHLYHLLYDLTGTMYNEETLDIGLMKVRNMWDVRADRDAAIRNEVLDEVIRKLDSEEFYHNKRWKYKMIIESLRTGTADKGGE